MENQQQEEIELIPTLYKITTSDKMTVMDVFVRNTFEEAKKHTEEHLGGKYNKFEWDNHLCKVSRIINNRPVGPTSFIYLEDIIAFG